MAKKRDYKHEYAAFQSSPKQIHQRSERNHARLETEKKLGHKLPKTQEVDHIKPLKKGGSNAPSNTRVVSRHTNRVKGSK